MIAPTSSISIYKVVKAVEADAEEICQVVNRAFQKDIFRSEERPRATVEVVRSRFEDGAHKWYVIRDANKIVATVLYSTDQASETADQGNIHMLAVLPEYRGKSLSSLLLQKAEKRAGKEQKSSIALIAAEINAHLVEFYKKEGYQPTGSKFNVPNRVVKKEFYGSEKNNPEGPSQINFLRMEKYLNPKA